MKVFSQLVSAQLENKTADYSSGTRGRIWIRTDTSPIVLKFDTGAAIKTLVDTDSTQTFTNKTWNGATISEAYGGTNQTTYAQGDIIYASAANTLAKLAKGSSGQFLKIGATIPEWATITATLGVKSKAFADSPYTILAGDDLILVDTSGGAVTLNLPASSGGGKVYRVKKTTSDFNAVTIARAGSDTIQDVVTGGTSTTLNTQGEELAIIDAASAVWQVIDRRIPSVFTSYTPTWSAGFGTVSNNAGYYRRVGDSIEVIAYATAGTVAGSIASVSLPSGLTVDGGKVVIGNTTSNPGQVIGVYAIQKPHANTFVVTATATSTSVVYFGDIGDTSSSAVPANGSTIADSSDIVSCRFLVAIAGWNG